MKLPSLGCLFFVLALGTGTAFAADAPDKGFRHPRPFHPVDGAFQPGALAVLPDDGRTIFLEAFAAARHQIRIEICVLEDNVILQGLQQALERGVQVRVIVDNGKYHAFAAEREHLATYVTAAGGQVHLSNPIFPRSFPKVIMIDQRYALIGSACLDSTTFDQYRDYAYVTDAPGIFSAVSRLFENDWQHSAADGESFPVYNPTPVSTHPDVIIAPVNAASRLVAFIQGAQWTLAVTSELLGNPTLESELAAAVVRGVRVRLIVPQVPNGVPPQVQELQIASLSTLDGAGIEVRVTRAPETAQSPYMHARTAIADGRRAYLGSISLSPDSATYNRDVGLILHASHVVDKLQSQFDIDFASNSHPYVGSTE